MISKFKTWWLYDNIHINWVLLGGWKYLVLMVIEHGPHSAEFGIHDLGPNKFFVQPSYSVHK